MKRSIDPQVFFDRLYFWTICGILCATPSFLLAANSGFDRRAMVTGTVIYILGYAFVTALPCYQGRVGRSRLGRRLRLAAMIRAGMALTGLIGVGLAALGWIQSFLSIFALLDFFPGMLAVSLTGWLSGQTANHMTDVGFGWTLFTTLVQGALVSVQLLVIAWLSLVFPDRKRENRLSDPSGNAPLVT